MELKKIRNYRICFKQTDGRRCLGLDKACHENDSRLKSFNKKNANHLYYKDMGFHMFFISYETVMTTTALRALFVQL